MCVIAGYVGTDGAATVLIEMLRREQGMGGGYYTGLATISDGRLHYRKTLGDLDALLRRTDAADLPGHLGIAHSRSQSGGEDSWAHPFVDTREELAYVANGAVGYFAHRQNLADIGSAALRRGARFRSAVAEKVGSYPVLGDGSCVHMSEIMAHEISWLLQGGDLVQALARAYCGVPSELAGLCIHTGSPDRLAGCRINMPMVVGRDAAATYAATTALALPNSADWILPVPANSSVGLDRWGARVERLAQPRAPVLPVPSAQTLTETLIAELRNHSPRAIGDLCKTAGALWPAGQLGQPNMAVFQVLWGLWREGRVRWDDIRVPGQYGRGTAPLTRFHWVAHS